MIYHHNNLLMVVRGSDISPHQCVDGSDISPHQCVDGSER